MRVIFWIWLLIHVSLASGQADSVVVITAEDAITEGLRNNPLLKSEIDKKILSRNIKSAWYQWLFRINQQLTIKDQMHWISDLDRIAELRYREGDIELLEKSYFLAEAAKIRASAVVIVNETEMTGNQLKLLLQYRTKIAPADSSLSIYQIIKAGGIIPYPGALEDSLTVINLQLKLDSYFTTLQYFTSFGLDHARLILQIAGKLSRRNRLP
jgi:hypothetical protein